LKHFSLTLILFNFICAIEKRKELGCGAYGSPTYCPVLTIGGSYPGFLSAMMRLRYPTVVDMAYSASSPNYIYAQTVDQYEYYKVITKSAEKASPGCPDAVRASLSALLSLTKNQIMKNLNICPKLPKYLQSFETADDLKLFVDEINMVVMYSFANLNMANYPPPNTSLRAACQAWQSAPSPLSGLSSFLMNYAQSGSSHTCFGRFYYDEFKAHCYQ
jgi:hypothetical protein